MELVIWNKYDQIVNVIIVLDYNKSTGQKTKRKTYCQNFESLILEEAKLHITQFVESPSQLDIFSVKGFNGTWQSFKNSEDNNGYQSRFNRWKPTDLILQWIPFSVFTPILQILALIDKSN